MSTAQYAEDNRDFTEAYDVDHLTALRSNKLNSLSFLQLQSVSSSLFVP